jgi:hypothetical protein
LNPHEELVDDWWTFSGIICSISFHLKGTSEFASRKTRKPMLMNTCVARQFWMKRAYEYPSLPGRNHMPVQS